jgi:hypothetical protein
LLQIVQHFSRWKRSKRTIRSGAIGPLSKITAREHRRP